MIFKVYIELIPIIALIIIVFLAGNPPVEKNK